MSDKPWWRRIDGVPPGFEHLFERRFERRAQPWTSRTIWFMRVGLVVFLAMAIWWTVAAASGARDAGLAIYCWVFPTFQSLFWTPTQRRQLIGRLPAPTRD
jgi:fatty acid desaturase